MSDFFSFEYFDDEPIVSHEDPNDHRTTFRKNQSLSASSAEFLRIAINRLVPSSFVYGDTGIGNRSYELYGLCVSHAFTGRKGNLLVACLCVMHSTYERRSELVILPSDIEAKFADLRIANLRTTCILKYYDEMCEKLKIPRLEPSIEHLFERILREGCKINSEQVMNQIITTALRIEEDLRSFTNVVPKNQRANKRKNYSIIWKVETIAATAVVLACRLHRISQGTLPDIAKEVNLDKSSISYLIIRFRKAREQYDIIEGSSADPSFGDRMTTKGGSPDTGNATKKRRRSEPLKIAGLEIPSGLTLSMKSSGRSTASKDEEVLRIFPRSYRGDPLSFIDDGKLLPVHDQSSYIPLDLPEGLGYELSIQALIPADVPPVPSDLEQEPDIRPLPPYKQSVSEYTKTKFESEASHMPNDFEKTTITDAGLDDFLDLLTSGPPKGHKVGPDEVYDEYVEDEQEYD
jgi:hypothetical protein